MPNPSSLAEDVISKLYYLYHYTNIKSPEFLKYFRRILQQNITHIRNSEFKIQLDSPLANFDCPSLSLSSVNLRIGTQLPTRFRLLFLPSMTSLESCRRIPSRCYHFVSRFRKGVDILSRYPRRSRARVFRFDRWKK